MGLPPGAIRCPTCGHTQGEALVVEIAAGDPRSRERRRDVLLVVGLVAVLVVALVFVGHDSGSRKTAAPQSTTTTTFETTTALPATTTAAAATTLPGLQLGAPSGIRLIVSSETAVVLLDLDSGSRTSLPIDRNAVLTPRRGGVVESNFSHRFVPEPYTGNGVQLGNADYAIASSFDDRMWLVRGGDPDGEIREVDVTGQTTAGPYSFSGRVAGAIDDGFVTVHHGSIFLTDRSGKVRRIGNGDVAAVANGSVLAYTCDAAGACGASIIDVDSGVVRAVGGIPDSPSDYGPGLVSPDGRKVVLPTSSNPATLVVVDLATAAVTPVPLGRTNIRAPSTAFSPDSSWLFASDGSSIVAQRIGGQEVHDIDVGFPIVNGIAAV